MPTKKATTRKTGRKMGAQEQQREDDKRALVRAVRREKAIKQLARGLAHSVRQADDAVIQFVRAYALRQGYELTEPITGGALEE